jgi:hypothetical protein
MWSAGSVQAQKSDRPTVTFDELMTLVKFNQDDDKILEALKKSAPSFILGDDQEKKLRAAGASDRLIAAIRKMNPADKVGEVTDLAIVLDCSGSMSYDTSDKRQKMEVAKGVTTNLIRGLPNGLNVTFIIYGHESFGETDERNCKAVKVVRPLSKLNDAGKQELTKFIAGLKPVGHTPIGLAVEVAGKELAKSQGTCGLVLITDGMETCHRDPAAEVAKLVRDLKMSFGVHVIGLGLKPEEKKAVADIAGKSGKYYDAQSSEDLAKSIKLVAEKVADAAKPAEEPKVVPAARRGLLVAEPKINFPKCKEIQLIVVDGAVSDVKARGKYGEPIRVPSASQKYQVYWVPEKGKPVLMIEDFSIAEQKVVEVKPEECLGLIKVNGKGKPKEGIVVRRGRGVVEVGATSTSFGEIMVVPVGTWDVYVDDNVLEEGLKVEAGKLHQIE